MKLLLSLLQISRSSSLDDEKTIFFWQQRVKLPLGNFSTSQLPILQPGSIFNHILHLGWRMPAKYCLCPEK